MITFILGFIVGLMAAIAAFIYVLIKDLPDE